MFCTAPHTMVIQYFIQYTANSKPTQSYVYLNVLLNVQLRDSMCRLSLDMFSLVPSEKESIPFRHKKRHYKEEKRREERERESL